MAVVGDFNLPPTKPPGRRARKGTKQPPQQPPQQGAPWDQFQSLGWRNLIPTDLPTNWGAQVPQHYDDIWLQGTAPAVVLSSGVFPALEYATRGNYPNHLMAYAQLDVAPAQPRTLSARHSKVRTLNPPLLAVAVEP